MSLSSFLSRKNHGSEQLQPDDRQIRDADYSTNTTPMQLFSVQKGKRRQHETSATKINDLSFDSKMKLKIAMQCACVLY
jgi:hypothetical protein